MAKEVFKAIVSNIGSANTIKENFEKAITYYSEKLKKEIINKLKAKYPNAIIETKNDNSFSNIFIWFPNEEVHFGVESFNNNSLFNNKNKEPKEQKHLVIGRVDWKGKEGGNNISHGIWLKDFPIKNICTKGELFQKLNEYSANNNHSVSKVVNEIFKDITTYIENSLSNE
jgi:hypothetical protein